MPTASIKTNIKLDGEKEYKAAVGEINTALGTLDSKLKLLKNTYAENKDNVEGLTKINETLNEKILTQKEKVSALEEALKNAAQEYGESDARTQKWQQQLNKANSTLIDMERELRDNTDALKDAGVEADNFSGGMDDLVEKTGAVDEKSASFGTTLQDVADKLGIQLPAGAQEAVNGLGGVNVAAGAAVFGLAALVTAIVKVEKALIDVTKESAGAASEILELSSVTGQSTDSIQEFAYASEMVGVSSDRIRDSLKEVTNKMQEARDGSEDVAAAWDKLGVSITDAEGNLRSAEDVFYDTIDALGQVQNRTERDAIAMDLMSESAQELNPLIDAGSAALRDYADEAHEMGYVLDNEALTALDNVDNGFSRLSNTTDALKNQIAAEFAPYLSEALEDIRALIEKVGKALIDSGAVEAFGSILESSVSLLEPLGSLVTTVLPALSAALKPVVEAVAILADATDLLVGLLSFDGDKIKTSLGLNASRGQLSHQQVASGAYSGYRYSESAGWIESGVHTETELRAEYAKNPTGTYEYWKQMHGYNAAGTDYWYGGRTLIGENGPEMAILPQGTRILTAQESRQASGGDTYNITIPASSIKEFEDIIRIVKNRRRVGRMGGASK